MLKWYSDLYVGQKIKNKSKSIIRKINKGVGQLGAYVITLAANEADQLEILSANFILDKMAQEVCPLIIGIAGSHDEAVGMVAEIVDEVLAETKTTDVRLFIENKVAM